MKKTLVDSKRLELVVAAELLMAEMAVEAPVVVEDLVGLEEEEGVHMPGTLALITTGHKGVACSNTPLLPWAGKDHLGLDRTEPRDLK